MYRLIELPGLDETELLRLDVGVLPERGANPISENRFTNVSGVASMRIFGICKTLKLYLREFVLAMLFEYVYILPGEMSEECGNLHASRLSM